VFDNSLDLYLNKTLKMTKKIDFLYMKKCLVKIKIFGNEEKSTRKEKKNLSNKVIEREIIKRNNWKILN